MVPAHVDSLRERHAQTRPGRVAATGQEGCRRETAIDACFLGGMSCFAALMYQVSTMKKAEHSGHIRALQALGKVCRRNDAATSDH